MDEMIPPGPKPVDVEHLKEEATEWAAFFYKLRDGQPGLMQRAKYATTRQQLQRIQRHPRWRKQGLPQIGPYLERPIIIPVSHASRALPAEMKTKGWTILRPLQPAPELWEQLKRAQTVAGIKKASRGISKWMSREFEDTQLPWPPIDFSDALDLYAETLLVGMKLPSYARTDRSRSDDKRVNHLAKVLAGARLGLAPITAVKRLSHWNLSKDWAEKALDALVKHSKERLSKTYGKAKA